MRPKTFPELSGTVELFKRLAPGWDSLGSPAMDPYAIDLAFRVLRIAQDLCLVPAAVCPTSGSGITIHFQNGAIEADFDIRPDCRMETWVFDPDFKKDDASPARSVPDTEEGVAVAIMAIKKFLRLDVV